MIKRLIPWFFIALTVGVLVGLGTWQLERLKWKNELLAKYEAGKTLPVLSLEAVEKDSLPSYAYRRVTLEGTFLHDKEIHMGGQRWHGKTGYHLVTPMEIADGRIFLVKRGWIPFELKEQEKRADSLPQEPVQLNGIIRIPKPPKLFTPESHPDKNFWFTLDLPALERFTELSFEPVFIEAIEAEPNINQFPIPSDGIRVFRNDHLGYAATWYLLAIAALIMFWARFLRKQ